MKIKLLIGAAAAVAVVAVLSSSAKIKKDNPSDAILKILEDIPTIQAFSKEAVPDTDLNRIVNAGVNAPSAMNRQPWHFTVISNAEDIDALGNAQKESMKNMPPRGRKGPKSGLGDSPVVIVISSAPGSEFDAGLACESMNSMANALGYGTKIISSCTLLFNGDKKAEYYEKFQIPEGQSIVAAILLGKINTAEYDAVTSATLRNPVENLVTFL